MPHRHSPSCKCNPNSPFRWHENLTSTLIDRTMRPAGYTALSIGQKATLIVEEQRAAGKNSSHTLHTSRKVDRANVKKLTVYAKAGNDQLFERKKSRSKG